MAIQSRFLWGIGSAVAVLAGAVFLFRMWPSDAERSVKLRKDFPESSQHYSETQRQNALIMELLKEAATTNENLARKPLSWKK